MAYTAVTVSIAVLSLVLRFDLLIKIVMLILPSVTYRPLVLILGMLDGKIPARNMGVYIPSN